MKGGIVGIQLIIFDERPVTGYSHCNSFLDGCLLIFIGTSRAIVLLVVLDHDVSAIHKLCDTAKSQHIIRLLEFIDDRIEGRLRKPSGGPPCIL